MKPKRHRVTVNPRCKLVVAQGGAVVPPCDEAYSGWAYEPLASVCCVVLDDGLELLIARTDVELDAPDTERSAVAT